MYNNAPARVPALNTWVKRQSNKSPPLLSNKAFNMGGAVGRKMDLINNRVLSG